LGSLETPLLKEGRKNDSRGFNRSDNFEERTDRSALSAKHTLRERYRMSGTVNSLRKPLALMRSTLVVSNTSLQRKFYTPYINKAF
jgi:hypothetical protein